MSESPRSGMPSEWALGIVYLLRGRVTSGTAVAVELESF